MEISGYGNAFSSALKGINRAQQKMDASAQKIADGSGELAKETVEQIEAEKTLGANVKTTQTADEMLQELMNLKR